MNLEIGPTGSPQRFSRSQGAQRKPALQSGRTFGTQDGD
jgi:hypothetical protein